MPIVQITWSEGRTPEQKRKVGERITNVLVEDANAKRESIIVAFHDLADFDFVAGGVQLNSHKKTP